MGERRNSNTSTQKTLQPNQKEEEFFDDSLAFPHLIQVRAEIATRFVASVTLVYPLPTEHPEISASLSPLHVLSLSETNVSK